MSKFWIIITVTSFFLKLVTLKKKKRKKGSKPLQQLQNKYLKAGWVKGTAGQEKTSAFYLYFCTI